MSRYMLEQKILGQNLVTPYAQQSTQPTMVSSPSSGYHTMSPPSSSTRRNSDTKESVDDLTATTTATNSDDDFHVSNSAPSSPPAQFLCRNLAYTQPNQRRHSPEEQWSQQQTQQPPTQCPPGFEWLQSASAGASVSQQPRPTAAAHFQPYVNDQFMSIGTATPVTPQQRPNGWYTQQQESVSYPNANGLPQQQQSRANQWDQRQLDVEKSNLSSVFNSNPALCDYLVQQLQHVSHFISYTHMIIIHNSRLLISSMFLATTPNSQFGKASKSSVSHWNSTFELYASNKGTKCRLSNDHQRQASILG